MRQVIVSPKKEPPSGLHVGYRSGRGAKEMLREEKNSAEDRVSPIFLRLRLRPKWPTMSSPIPASVHFSIEARLVDGFKCLIISQRS